MASLEEATEIYSDPFGDYMEEEFLFASSCSFRDREVSVPALLNVICHKVAKVKDSTPLPPECLSQEHTQVIPLEFASI